MAATARALRIAATVGGYAALVGWVLFAMLVIVLRYVVLPNVGHYRADIERFASRATGETVRIGSIAASWRGLHPSLALADIRVVDAAGATTLALPSVRATLSWDTLPALQLRLASLEVDASELVLRRDAAGRFYVAGYAIRTPATPDHRAAEWLLAQDRVAVHAARIVWRDESADDAEAGAAGGVPPVARPDLVFTDVGIAIERSARRHRAALRATPPAALGAPLDLRAVVDHPLFAERLSDPAEWRGEVYADVASGDVVAWKTWLPIPSTVDGGRGRARVWATFARADAPAGVFARRLAERIGRPVPAALDRIASVTADLALDDVAVRWGAMGDAQDAADHASIASIDGRVAAAQTVTEQRFAAIRMALQPRDAARVAPTDFELRRTIGAARDDESGSATLGAIDIGASLALVPAALVPPAIAARLAALRPRGALEKVAVRWTGPVAAPSTFEAEARFARLAIAPQAPTPEAIAAAAREVVAANGLVRKPRRAFGAPGFENLAGTLTATRTAAAKAGDLPTTRATLALAGEDVALVAPGLFDEPTLRFAHLAADVGVRMQGADVEVTIARAAVDNADLAATVDATFRHGPQSGGTGADGGRGWIDLDAHVARADVARVPRYLPNIIGERTRVYLRRALIAGTVDEARLRMRGPIEKLNPRELAGALATPYPVTVTAALAAVRDAPTRAAPAVDAAPDGDDPLFHAFVKVHGATFRYGPGRQPDDPPPANGQPPSPTSFIPWPAFDDVDADIVFDQARMTVRARAARVYGYRLTDITAELPALADPRHVLRVVGRGTGPMQDLIRFMNESPIARWMRGFTTTTKATGDAALALALDLPLGHPRETEVAGSLRFAHNDLALNPIVPPLVGIEGRMDFSDRGLAIDGITATALGGPLRIDATTGSDGYIALNADGTIDVAALQKSAHETEADGLATPVSNAVDRAATFLSGRADYQVALRVRSKRVTDLADNGAAPPPAGSAQPDLVVRSDLKGLAIDLPAPFAKPADTPWPLRIALARTVSTSATTPDTEDIRVTLADVATVDIARQRTPEGALAVTHAGYRVGADPTAADAQPPASAVTIDLPSLDLDAWRAAFRRMTPPASAARPAAPAPSTTSASAEAFLPSHATLRTGALHAAGRAFTNVVVTADRTGAGWQADLAADQVAGRVSYTDVSGRTDAKGGVAAPASARLVARLTHLTIPESEPGAGPAATQADDALDADRQRAFPAIDVVVDRFELRGRALGRLEVVARNVDTDASREWQLQKLGLTVPEARFAASGVWGRGDDGERTRLDFDLESSDVGALMDRFGLKRTIDQGSARLSGTAAWNGGPSRIDFGSLSGSLKLAADRGQFLKAEPGVAKLLNVLSLQGLARRLTLDFRDVFSPGFAFDTVRADATVDHGIATTDDFTMRGVEALVTMSGSADLARETADLRVHVEPQINAGAASLGVAVVNPVVGLATFAAQYLFKDSLSRALSFEYNVSGPWARPDVVRIDRKGRATPVVPKDAVTTRKE